MNTWTLKISNLTEWEAEKILDKARAIIGKQRTEKNAIMLNEDGESLGEFVIEKRD